MEYSPLYQPPESKLSPSLAVALTSLLISGVVGPCLSIFTGPTNHMEILLKCRFWFSMVRVGPEILHFQQAPQWRCCWSGDHTETTGKVIRGAGSLIMKSSIHRNKLQTILKDLPVGQYKVRDLNSEYYKFIRLGLEGAWTRIFLSFAERFFVSAFFLLVFPGPSLLLLPLLPHDTLLLPFPPPPTPTLFTCLVLSIWSWLLCWCSHQFSGPEGPEPVPKLWNGSNGKNHKVKFKGKTELYYWENFFQLQIQMLTIEFWFPWCSRSNEV